MKFPFFSKKIQKQSYYLGIFLKEEEGILLVISQSATGAIVQEREKFNYSNGWENLSNDIDEILYRMEKKFNYQFSRTIFFVYSHLVDDKTGDIKKPYLQKIKDLVKNLEIEAVGYIECYEAVSSLLEEKEEIPLTAVLVELDKSQIGIFVYKGGKLSSKKIIAKTDNIALDLVKSFEDFKGKIILPARIILYDSHQLDSASSEIISHRWNEDYFVQVPRVDIFGEDQVIEGLVKAFYQQLKETKTDLNTISENIKESSVMGFMIDEDIKNTNIVENKIIKQGFNIFAKIKNQISKIKIRKPSVKINLSGKLLVFAGALIIIVSLFLNEYFLHKVNLIVYLPSIKINKDLDVETDFKVTTSSATLNEEIMTTGKKDIGDPSTGTVTVHNFSDAEKTFSKGTILDVSGMKFLLNNDVKVASSSLAADGSAKLPGKNTVSISASLIGPEGNLSKGQRFKIADLQISTYFAINDAPLTGGTKKQIKTASSSDQEELKKLILSKADENIRLLANTSGYEFVPKLTDTKINKISFSKEVGEEGDKISAKATTLTTKYGYSNQNINKKVFLLAKNNVQSGYVLTEEMISYKINKVEKKNDLLKLNISAVGKSIKNVSKKEIIQSVKGADVKNMVTETVKIYGGVDILVNNAGIFPFITVSQMKMEEFDQVIAVNLRGVFLCTKYVAEQMIKQGKGGRIINITSIDAIHPSMVGLAHYDASKHGVWGFTKNVALELAPHKIWVNAVAPGGVMTHGVAVAQAQGKPVTVERNPEPPKMEIAMGRMGVPDDIGKVVLFLASDMASYMTGSQIVVDGGYLLK